MRNVKDKVKQTLPAKILGCINRAIVNTINHDGIEHAGYLAFLGLLALFPFLVFIVAVIGFIGQGEVGEAVISSALEALPARLTAALRPRIVEIISGPPQGLLTVSILGAIWTASSAVEGLRTVLNRAYHVVTPPSYWFRRSLSILQLLFFAFIMVVAMIMLVGMPLYVQNLEGWLHVHFITEYHEQISTMAVQASILGLFIAISFIYYLLPNIKQRFISVAPGAGIVVVAWLGAAHLFTLYLANFNQVSLIYGSLGGIIAALVFAYVCNIIFIFGAELNYQLARTLGWHFHQHKAENEPQ
jgi:membrane protein